MGNKKVTYKLVEIEFFAPMSIHPIVSKELKLSIYYLIVHLNYLVSLSIYFLLMSKGKDSQVNRGKAG